MPSIVTLEASASETSCTMRAMASSRRGVGTDVGETDMPVDVVTRPVLTSETYRALTSRS